MGGPAPKWLSWDVLLLSPLMLRAGPCPGAVLGDRVEPHQVPGGILSHMCPWPKAHPIYSSPCQTLTHSTALAEGSVMVVSLGIIKKTNLGEMSACMHIPSSAPILPCSRRPGLASTRSPLTPQPLHWDRPLSGSPFPRPPGPRELCPGVSAVQGGQQDAAHTLCSPATLCQEIW